MTGRARIDRKARLAVLALMLMILFPLALALRNCAASTKSDQILPAAGADYGEIVQIGESTMLLERGSAGDRIAEWVRSGKNTYLFVVDDKIFEPGSAAPSPDGEVRIARFAQLMEAIPQLRASISVSGGGSAGIPQASLLQARAHQLRGELIARGVDDSRVEPAQTHASRPNEAVEGSRPSVVVTLSRHGD